MKLVFMGTPAFSVPALDALASAGHEIAVVYTQPPRPAGRGQKEQRSPVHARAKELGITVRHPKSLRDADEQTAFRDIGAEVAVVVAYGLILPQPVLDAPKRGCLNIHASLLPRWRGAAPIHRAILAGDAETGVCIMQMEAGLDTGPVLLRQATPISSDEITADLHDRLAGIGADLIVRALRHLPDLEPQAQPDEGVTYAHKIDKAEARIDWTKHADAVDRHVRGLSPFPGAWTTLGGRRLKLLRSTMVDGSGRPGEVLNDLTIACGKGAIAVTEVQIEGRARQGMRDFLNGTPVPPGTIVGG
ncbi:MAG: methionyl-tRNA formyltransferase [Pseudomonadota bacterium]